MLQILCLRIFGKHHFTYMELDFPTNLLIFKLQVSKKAGCDRETFISFIMYRDPRGAAGFLDYVELGRNEPPPLIERFSKRPKTLSIRNTYIETTFSERSPSNENVINSTTKR